jgi:hypothetical protein
MQIIWTKHAKERQQQWQQRLEITREEIETTVTQPQQIITEDEVFVAQSIRGNGLLRVVFTDIGDIRRIITLYWTNQINRYWQE